MIMIIAIMSDNDDDYDINDDDGDDASGDVS